MPKTMEEILQELATKPEDELMHYGRKGMKWYQHIFGKKPSSQSGNTQVKYKEGLRKSGSRSEQASTAKRISNKDLSSIIKRLEMENKYVNLTSKDPVWTRLLDWVKRRGGTVVNTTLTEVQKAYIKEAVRKGK